MAFNWTCPHCATPQSVIDDKFRTYTQRIYLKDQSDGMLSSRIVAVGCANDECTKQTVIVSLGESTYDGSSWVFIDDEDLIFHERIYPHGSSIPQPDFIPKALRDDYREACLVRDLSPKASATLIRRCLQGMIRDFAGISGKTLFDEIQTLRKAVEDGTADRAISGESVEAIDHVRGIGNIGAHMEKDIDLIIDVDPGEAQALIELVEMLFDEWYGAREKRRLRLAHIGQIAGDKKALKDQSAPPPQLPPPDSK